MARLSERASEPLVPALVAYARSPGAIAELRRFFVLAPTVRDRTLSLLAGDARNAPLVLALMPDPRSVSKDSDWPRRLVQSMVLSGDYAGAEAMWTRLSGVTDRGLLYNPQFRDLPAPPPFNWNYGSGSSGVAEPSGSGGLDVIYYGREDATLANQMLRLAPGRYRLDADRRPVAVERGRWTILCYPGRLRFSNAAWNRRQGIVSGMFAVPATGCAAPSLELRGRPGQATETAQLSIADLTLERVATGS